MHFQHFFDTGYTSSNSKITFYTEIQVRQILKVLENILIKISKANSL